MDAHPGSDRTKAASGTYLSLLLAGEMYCIDVMKIREILAATTITPIPRTPEFIKGVINLRGRILPVIDLRVRFQMAQKPAACIVIVESETTGGKIQMGILADEVCEVLHVAADKIEPVPSFNAQIDISFLLGISRSRERIVFLLDSDRALNHEEFVSLEAARTQMLESISGKEES